MNTIKSRQTPEAPKYAGLSQKNMIKTPVKSMVGGERVELPTSSV